MKINEKNLIAYGISRDHIDKEGYLLKKGEINKTFHRRWFVLKGNLLYYFEKKGDKEPLGVVILEGCTTELAESEEHYVFKIIFHGSNSKVYELSSETQEELEVWMKYIARASYDYLKLMVAELQKQLEELEAAENSCSNDCVVPPVSVCSLPSSVLHRQRENPFNRNEEMSLSDLWKCNESLQSASSLLSQSSCQSGASSTSSAGSVRVNPSLPPSIPFRTAPPPPPILKTTSSNKVPSIKKKTFFDLHKEYSLQILQDRINYSSVKLKAYCDNFKNSNCFIKTENLIDL